MHDHETFEDEDFAARRPFSGEVYDCTFRRCDFTESDLSGVAFVDCTFEACNLSMARLGDTRLQSVAFTDCKMVGVELSACSDFAFAADFAGCRLDYASLQGKRLRGADFTGASLAQANLAGADLSEAVLADCALEGAVFERTTLTGADLRGARDFRIDPETNTVGGAKVSRAALEGFLVQYGLEVE